MLDNADLREFELINNEKVEKYAQRRRLYVFIVATEILSLYELGLQNVFEDGCENLEDL